MTFQSHLFVDVLIRFETNRFVWFLKSYSHFLIFCFLKTSKFLHIKYVDDIILEKNHNSVVVFTGLSKHTPYPVNSLKLKKILLEQMNNNKSSKGHGMSQSTSRSSSSGGSSQSETNYSKIVNKVERIKIEDENNGNSPRTASVTPTNNEPSTIGSNAITDEDKHNGNNVNKSNEPETRYIPAIYFKFSLFEFLCTFVEIEIKFIFFPNDLRF